MCTALIVSSYIWVFLWEACIAINLWITVVLQLKKNQQEAIRAKFLPVTAACSVLAPAICLAGWNVGYDWAGYSGSATTSVHALLLLLLESRRITRLFSTAAGPVCLFLFTEEQGYYWALFFSECSRHCECEYHRIFLILQFCPRAQLRSC